MKHISTIIDDLDLELNLNDDLAHEYELDRRNDEFYSPELDDQHPMDYFEAMHERLHDGFYSKEVRNG